VSSKDGLVLLPDDPQKPVASKNGRLLQPVSIKGYPIKMRPPTKAAEASGKGYITISYYKFGVRKNTSGGYTLDEALEAVLEILPKIALWQDNPPVRIGELIDRYTDPDRFNPAHPWSVKHRYNVERLVKLYIKPIIGQVRIKDFAPPHAEACIDAAPTAGEGKRVKALLRAVFRFGEEKKYVDIPADSHIRGVWWKAPKKEDKKSETDEQKETSEDVKESNTKRLAATQVGKAPPRVQGESSLSVPEDKFPLLDDIYELAVCLRVRNIGDRGNGTTDSPWWWEMMPIFAAFTGLRIGEFLGLAASDVALAPSRIVKVRRQYMDMTRQFTAPKRNKTRETQYPAVTPPGKHFPNGYPLGEMVAKRKREVEERLAAWPADKPAFTDRDGLMFPSLRGVPWTQSNFSRRAFQPAARQANWPLLENGDLKWTWHNLRHFFARYQIRDRGIDAALVSKVMGHSKTSTTMNLYVKTGSDDVATLYPE
jgi:integrase